MELHDSGERQEFETGAQRDTAKGKTRWNLVYWPAIERMVKVLEAGSEKYNDWNWAKGIPASRTWESAMRHLIEIHEGQSDDPDPLANLMCNIMFLMHLQEKTANGELPAELWDIAHYPGAEQVNHLTGLDPVSFNRWFRENFIKDDRSWED